MSVSDRDSASLMREFAQSGSQEAFDELVSRYLPVVFQAAKRRCGNAALAEEVAQLVFIDFATRMPSLRASDRIGAWLHRASVFRANDVMKSEHRRKSREQQAAAMMELERLTQAESWQALSPVMDQALNGLRTKDREIIVMRHLEGNGISGLASKLGIGESAAKKRLERAMDRLRSALRRRGVAVAVPLLATLMHDSVSASEVSPEMAQHVSAESLIDLSAGGPAVWWFRYGPVPRYFWLGAAATVVCGVGPMVASLQGPELEVQTAVEGTFTDVLVRRSRTVPPPPPHRPLIVEDMSVPEIVEALGQLYARPLTHLDKERCRLLWKQIPSEQAKEALLLTDATWPAITKRLCDQSNINCRADLCGAWLKHEPEAAVRWAVARLKPGADEYVDRWQWCEIAASGIREWAQRDWDRAWAWVEAGISDGSLLVADDRMDLPTRIGVHLSDLIVENMGLRAAIDALGGMQNLSPAGQQGGDSALGGIVTHLESDKDFQYMMNVALDIASPTARVALRERVMASWSKRHRESAMAWVESLEYPGERSRYALELAFPYTSDDDTPPDYSALAKWWQSLDSSPGRDTRHGARRHVINRWMKHDPTGAADWLVRNYPISEYGELIWSRLITSSSPETDLQRTWESESLLLAGKWKDEHADAFLSKVANSRRNNRHRPDVLTRLNVVEAALNQKAP